MATSRARRATLLLAAASASVLLLGACGAGRFAVGTVPFPTRKPVMTDASGQYLTGLPDPGGKSTIVVIDAPWCPPCLTAWEAVARASSEVGGATSEVRVVRILFDRETRYSPSGTFEVPPLIPAAPASAGEFRVTTFTALTVPFRERLGIDQVPTIVLLDPQGVVVNRWRGTTPSLAREIAKAIKDRSTASPSTPGM